MNHFFAYLSRLNHIYRWSLMRNTFPENVAEHTAQVAFIAHGIATIGNVRYGRGYDIGRITQLALFHDAGEVLTGDLATPIQISERGNQGCVQAGRRRRGQAAPQNAPRRSQGDLRRPAHSP